MIINRKVKEIDRFKSLKHKGKSISELIIYEMADNTIVSAETTLIMTSEVDKYITSTEKQEYEYE